MEIKDIDIDWISILTDDWIPKNGRVPIIKGDNSKVKIVKSDPIKGLLFAEVFYANVEDKDKDEPTNDAVEKGCFDYMRKITKGGAVKLDSNHNNQALDNVYLVENHVDRSSDNWSHKITIDFSGNEELMKKAEKSAINGISPEGTVTRISKADEDEGLFRKFLNFVGISKAQTAEKIAETEPIENINKAIDAFRSSVIAWRDYEPYGSYMKVSTDEEFYANVDDLTTYLKGIKITNMKKGDNMENFNEFIKTEEGLKALEEAGYIKKLEQENEVEKATETQTEPEKETSEEPNKEVEVLKAEFTAKLDSLTKELEAVKKARVTDGEETTAQGKDIDEMSGEELKAFRETDPAGYKKAIQEKAKTI